MIGLKCGVTWDFKVIAARVSRKNYIWDLGRADMKNRPNLRKLAQFENMMCSGSVKRAIVTEITRNGRQRLLSRFSEMNHIH